MAVDKKLRIVHEKRNKKRGKNLNSQFWSFKFRNLVQLGPNVLHELGDLVRVRHNLDPAALKVQHVLPWNFSKNISFFFKHSIREIVLTLLQLNVGARAPEEDHGVNGHHTHLADEHAGSPGSKNTVIQNKLRKIKCFVQLCHKTHTWSSRCKRGKETRMPGPSGRRRRGERGRSRPPGSWTCSPKKEKID